MTLPGELWTAGDVATLVAGYEARIAELLAVNAAQQAQITRLLARVADLERQVGLNSSNSGKPPTSDGLKKPPRTTSLRERSDKPPGAQAGHTGKTLCQTPTPDHTIDHYRTTCRGCGAPLDPTMAIGHATRQVFDLPAPQPLVSTEHRAHRCLCPTCGTQTGAAFPEDVAAPVQYGPRLGAVVVYLLHFQLLPEQRLIELLADLFGVSLASGTIARLSRAYAARCSGVVATLRDLVAAAPLKHLDETGFRIAGKTCWLHIAATRWLTFYRTDPRRGSRLDNLVGIVVHDHWKPYYKLKSVVHALCNAHHLRELQALIEIEQEDWARQMRGLLRRACHAANLARDRGKPLSPRLIGLFEARYDRIVALGLRFHQNQPTLVADATAKRRGRPARRVGHNLLRRLDTHRADVLRFLADPAVPFTNNLAERDARMMKLRQKISGGFRSEQGAKDFAVIRSLLSTARKQGLDLLQTLNAEPGTLVAKLKLA
jgi:transposase